MKRNACANLCKANADGYEMTEDSVNVKLHKAKVKIGVVMEAMLKFRGKERDVKELLSIFEAILESKHFEYIEVVNSYKCRD